MELKWDVPSDDVVVVARSPALHVKCLLQGHVDELCINRKSQIPEGLCCEESSTEAKDGFAMLCNANALSLGAQRIHPLHSALPHLQHGI